MYTLLTLNAAIAIYALARLLTDPRAVEPIGSQLRTVLQTWSSPPAPKSPPAVDLYAGVAKSPPAVWRAWISRHRWAPFHTLETDLAWLAFIVFSAATLLTHNTAVLFPLATNLAVFGLLLHHRTRKAERPAGLHAPSLRNWLIAQAGILLLWSPWLGAFIHQVSGVLEQFWIPAPDTRTVIQALMTFLNASTPTPGQTGDPPAWMWIPYAVALGLGLWHFWKKPARWLLLATLFTVPFVGELLVSIRRPIFYDRTLIWITIPLFLLLAAGIAQLRYRFLILAALGVFGANNLFAVSDYFRFLVKEDWHTAAGYVANFAEPQDLVLFNGNWVQIPFDYYFREYEDLYSIEVEKRGLPEDMFASGVLEPVMTENDLPRLQALLTGRDRAWLVYSHDWYTDPQGLIPQTLEKGMRIVRQRPFYGGVVLLYAKP